MRNTFQLLIGLFVNIETNHMCHQVYAFLFQLFGCRAGIGIAGLFAVGDKDDRRFLFSIFQLIRRFFQRSADRCLTLGLDRHHSIDDLFLIHFADRDNCLDIVTVSLGAMPIDCQSQLHIGIPLIDDIPECLSGNLNLCFAIDLTPHTSRRIEDDHRTGIFLCR